MSTFESYVIKSILSVNDFNIISVNNLESLKSMSFDRKQYHEIIQLIKAKNFTQINSLSFGTNNFEFLEIMKFDDQNKKNYIVTVYSNNALENDPQVIDIIPLENEINYKDFFKSGEL